MNLAVGKVLENILSYRLKGNYAWKLNNDLQGPQYNIVEQRQSIQLWSMLIFTDSQHLDVKAYYWSVRCWYVLFLYFYV